MAEDRLPHHRPRIDRWLPLALVLVVSAWVLTTAMDAHVPVNPASRYATIEALVDHGTWAIDDTSFVRQTVDKVYWDGHYYSSKPPLLPWIGAQVYRVIQAVTGWTFADNRASVVPVMRISLAWLPWLLGVGLMRRLLAIVTPDRHAQLWGVSAWILGSLPTAYASHLDNHSLATVAILGAGVLYWEATAAGHSREPEAIHSREPEASHSREPKASYALAAGLCAGLAVAFDLGAIPLVGTLGLLGVVWALKDRQWGIAAALTAGALIAPLAQVLLQQGIAGTWRPFYLIPSAYDYPGSYWRNPGDFDALREAKAVYAFHALVGHHGLFSVTPWLIFALVAPWVAPKTARARWLMGAGLTAAALTVAYYVHRTHNYGGRCVGMRWFMVIHPALALAAVHALGRTGWAKRYPLWVAIPVGAAAAGTLAALINPWESGVVHMVFELLGLGSG